MAEYGVTDAGFVKKRYDTIYEEIQSDVEKGTGIDISTNPKSYINVLLSSIADKLASVWEVAESVYYSMFPSTAEGKNLDYVCEFAGITRSEGTATKYYILCTGNDGSSIKAGTRLSSDTQPKYYFTITEDQSISRSNFNKAEIVISGSVIDGNSYIVTIEGNERPYNYTDSSIEDAYKEMVNALGETESDTISDYDKQRVILYKLAEDINKAGLSVTASLVTDTGTPVLSLVSDQAYVNYSYDLNENLTSQSVTSIILFESEDLEDVVLPAGTIINIESTLVSDNDGFMECTNLPTMIHGKARESDEELRQSYLAKQAYRSTTTIESIKSAILMNVDDVLSVAGFENDTGSSVVIGSRSVYGETIGGESVPAHSIAIIVDGGDEARIAETILKYKAAGIGTYGKSHHVEVPTGTNSSIIINYSNPEEVSVHLDVMIEPNTDEPMPKEYVSLIKDAIKEYTDGLTSGQNVIIQKAITNINNTVPGIAYIVIDATYEQDTIELDANGDFVYTDEDNTELSIITEECKTKKYIVIDAWHKANFEKEDGTMDITVYLYDTDESISKDGNLYKDAEGTYYHTSGVAIYKDNVYYDSEGGYFDGVNTYTDSDGVLILDSNFYYDKVESKDEDGNVVYNKVNLLSSNSEYYDSDEVLILDSEGNYYAKGSDRGYKIVDSDGKYYYSNGDPLYSEGTYYDSNGTPMASISYDQYGNRQIDYYDSEGKPIVLNNHYYGADDTDYDLIYSAENGIFNALWIGEICVIETSGNIYSRETSKLIIDNRGNVYGREGYIIINADDSIYDGSINEITLINADGNYYDSNGKKIIDSKGNYYGRNEELIKDSEGNWYRDGKLIKDVDGNYYRREGSLMTDKDFTTFYDIDGHVIVDSEGVYDDDGNTVISYATEGDDG